MIRVLDAAVGEQMPVGFYGSTPEVLDKLVKRLYTQHPDLNITFTYSPPFRDLSPDEDQEVIKRINASGANILFVGLGCPKQEKWMAAHRGKVHAVMLGVGAAFDFHAGAKPQAPMWMQKTGLEWFFRFVNEPKRLWRRYLYHNLRFVLLAFADLLGILR
jgi:N-acetylglucosaminyldiphosphoundecaprenol N-acetyl-beta-D-mannosaminyltransferase